MTTYASGSLFYSQEISNCDGSTREHKLLQVLSSSSLCGWLVPVTVSSISDTLEYYVMSDYIGVGTPREDYFRTPLTPITAQKLANQFNCTLPTRKMVDQIWKAAGIKLSPKTYAPKQGEPGRTSSKAYKISNDKIEEQLKTKTVTIGSLLAGHKKDVVISKILEKKSDVVVIYGWFYSDGKPIQPLYGGHGNFYVDYSHGIRLVKNECLLNGAPANLQDILKDPKLSSLISDEGPLTITKYKI